MEERVARLEAMAAGMPSRPASSSSARVRTGGSVPQTSDRGPWG
jgi:hypothetical protein